MVYLISYDLDHYARPERYDHVHTAIAGNAISWKRPLYSQWLVETSASLDQWAEILKGVINPATDHFLILPVTRGTYQGWLPQAVWDWLNSRI